MRYSGKARSWLAWRSQDLTAKLDRTWEGDMRISVAALLLMLAACGTSSSGVVSTGTETFMIAGEGRSRSADTVSADLYREATAYCADQKKNLKVIKTSGRDGNFGRNASSRLDFTCVDKN